MDAQHLGPYRSLIAEAFEASENDRIGGMSVCSIFIAKLEGLGPDGPLLLDALEEVTKSAVGSELAPYAWLWGALAANGIVRPAVADLLNEARSRTIQLGARSEEDRVLLEDLTCTISLIQEKKA